jgi:hypothetical protein
LRTWGHRTAAEAQAQVLTRVHLRVARRFQRATLPTVRTALVAAAAGLPFLLSAGPAAANGRFPLANQIVFSPSDPNVIVLRATYGIFLSRDNGKTWPLICEDVLGLPTTTNNYEDPELGFTANGSLLAGLLRPTSGLDTSTDLGCNWSCSGGALANQAIADLVVRPDKTNVVLAVTQTFEDAGTYSQVFESTDNGATWTALGSPFDPSFLVTTIDVSASDPNRIYVAGTTGFGAAKTASLLVSADHGGTWTKNPLPGAMFDFNTEDSIYIGAVDPTDPNRVYLRSSGVVDGGQSRLTYTTGTDTNLTFHPAKMFMTPQTSNIVGELLGFALSPVGSKVYVGTLESGLWVAARADMIFHQASNIQVACLATRGSELWACSKEVSGFIAGVSTDDGACFYPKLHICGMRAAISCNANPGGPIGCGADANASLCSGDPLASIDPAIGCVSADASENSQLPFVGACDGGSGSGDGGIKSTTSGGGCSCSIVGGGGAAAGLAASWALAALAFKRRRSR